MVSRLHLLIVVPEDENNAMVYKAERLVQAAGVCVCRVYHQSDIEIKSIPLPLCVGTTASESR